MCFPLCLVPTYKQAPCFEISDLLAATTRHDDRYGLAYVELTRNDLSLKGVFPPHMQHRVLPDYYLDIAVNLVFCMYHVVYSEC